MECICPLADSFPLAGVESKFGSRFEPDEFPNRQADEGFKLDVGQIGAARWLRWPNEQRQKTTTTSQWQHIGRRLAGAGESCRPAAPDASATRNKQTEIRIVSPFAPAPGLTDPGACRAPGPRMGPPRRWAGSLLPGARKWSS